MQHDRGMPRRGPHGWRRLGTISSRRGASIRELAVFALLAASLGWGAALRAREKEVGPHALRGAVGLPVPTVGFTTGAASAPEGRAAAAVEVRLSAASARTITVQYAAAGGTAHATPHGSGRDYKLPQGPLIFPPGTTTRILRFTVLEDSTFEADEHVRIRLSAPVGATLHTASEFTYTIVDNDRPALASVRDFGARGDGVADDTDAVQRAIEHVYARGGGVVLFPSGTYKVTSVNIREGITYEGDAAVITRPPMQGKWTRTFTTERVLHSADADSRPLIIRGITFDGNSANQGAYTAHELEQAHLIFLYGDPARRGRLRAVVEDCHLRNGVADGISVSTNVTVKVYNCDAEDVFRGGFVLTGGHSRAEVHTFTTRGQRDPTGIDVEVDGRGFGGTLRVDVTLVNLRLLDGDFDVGVHDGSRVVGRGIEARAPFYLYAENSSVHISDCSFEIGYPDSYGNRIVYPKDVSFTNCTFTARELLPAPDADRALRVADVYWNFDWAPKPWRTNQSLVFTNCRFEVGEDVEPGDAVYVVGTTLDDPRNGNRVVVQGGSVSPRFDGVFAPQCVGCAVERMAVAAPHVREDGSGAGR